MTRGGRATRTRGPTTADQLSLYAYREQSERGSAGAVRAARARSDGVRSTPRRFPRAAATRASGPSAAPLAGSPAALASAGDVEALLRVLLHVADCSGESRSHAGAGGQQPEQQPCCAPRRAWVRASPLHVMSGARARAVAPRRRAPRSPRAARRCQKSAPARRPSALRRQPRSHPRQQQRARQQRQAPASPRSSTTPTCRAARRARCG